MIITQVVESSAVGEYTVIINYNNNTITTILDVNVFVYSFDKEELISTMLEVAPNKNLEDFILFFILGDEDLTDYYLKLIKYM